MKKFATEFARYVLLQPMAFWFWAIVYGLLVFMFTVSVQLIVQ